MAKIILEPGDYIAAIKSSEDIARGIVLRGKKALLIRGDGGRSGFTIELVDAIPAHAKLVDKDSTSWPKEIELALEAVIRVLKLEPKL